MKAKLIKKNDDYFLEVDFWYPKYIRPSLIANTFKKPDGDMYNLSKQNCDSLFGVIDVEKLADDYFKSTNENSVLWRRIDYKAGFNKAMELNKDKLFTVEDMRTAMLNAIEMTDFQKEQFRKDNDYHIALDIIQSLQQPVEIDVEIEMECLDPNCDGIDKKGVCIPGDKPKLDSSGFLVLRKL